MALAALGAALGVMQLASDAIFSRAAVPTSLPAHVPAAWGVAIYSAIETVAPAPYVEAMLAQAALDRHDPSRAQVYAERMPASPAREDLLGRIAQAGGDTAAAQQHFIASADVFAIQNEVSRLTKLHVTAAYELELRLANRLEQTATHPDALADAYWRLGRLATLRGYLDSTKRRSWFETGMRDYADAVGLAPLSEKYLIAAGSQALNVDDPAQAQRYFRRAADLNPASADAYAGLGVAAFRLGDTAAARAYARTSRSYDPRSHFLHTLEALLK